MHEKFENVRSVVWVLILMQFDLYNIHKSYINMFKNQLCYNILAVFFCSEVELG